MNSLYDYSILTEAIIVFTWATPAWYMYITFRESGRSQRSAWIAFAIPLFWAALAWYLAKYGALDAAFDTFYVHEYFHEAQGFAAVPFVQRGGIKERKFSDDGLQYHKSNPDYADGVWAIVSVDLSKLSGKTRRVNITLPERVLNLMDKYATEHGETRSGFITSPSAGGCTPSSTCLCGIGTQGGRCLALPILRGSAAPLSSQPSRHPASAVLSLNEAKHFSSGNASALADDSRMCYHVAVNKRHRQTLDRIFQTPVRTSLEWRDIEALFLAAGARIVEGRGSRVRFELNGVVATFHRPHPEKEAKPYQVRDARRFLEQAGIKP